MIPDIPVAEALAIQARSHEAFGQAVVSIPVATWVATFTYLFLWMLVFANTKKES